jgi:hypothetical protein
MWKKIKKYILPAIILVALAVFLFVKFYIFKVSDTSVSSRKADIELTAIDLLKSFEADEKAANTQYLNKVVQVKGLVDNVTESKADFAVYLKEKDNTSGVMCSFDKSEFQKNPIKAGDQVSIKGICNGYLMDVVLNKCAVEK